MSMDFYPAIDIKEGKIIRLKKGLLLNSLKFMGLTLY